MGRNAAECQINRAVMFGGGRQEQKIFVRVSEISPGEKYLRKGAIFE